MFVEYQHKKDLSEFIVWTDCNENTTLYLHKNVYIMFIYDGFLYFNQKELADFAIF